ncbi:MAG: hypothetical protein IKX18_03100, partial [Muribaculaceae bacterium]|nr:hypothetical protein [Muribaculaceae bacterium]
MLAAHAGQVLGRDAEFVGIGLYAAVGIAVLGEHQHEPSIDAVALSQHLAVAVVVKVLVDVGQQVIGKTADDVTHRLPPEVHLLVVHLEDEQFIIL